MNPKTSTTRAQEPPRRFLEEFKRLKHLWPFLKPHTRLIVMAACLIPVIAGLQALVPIIIKFAIDEAIVPALENGDKVAASKDLLLLFSGAYVAALVIEYFSRVVHAMSAAYAVHRMIRTLRDTLTKHILKLKASYHDKSMSGALVTRATSDFDNLSDSLNMGVLTSIVDLSVLGFTVIGMLWLNWKLALCAIVILPLVAWIVRSFSIALKKAMLHARRKIASLNAFTQECLYGNTTIKVLAGEDQAIKKYDELNISYRNAQMSSVILDATMFSILDGIAYITMGVLTFWMAYQWTSLSSAISAGVLVAFVQYIGQMFEPLKHLGNKMAMLQGAFTSIDRIFGILDRKEFIDGSTPPPHFSGRVEFDRVRFSYGDSEERVLKDVNFDLDPGQSLAIVGPTGSGKSTIIKLASKLYDGYEGTIRIDGHDIRDYDPVLLRRQIAIVPQDIVLFDGDIAFNIGLGLVTDEAKILAAAESVGAHLFINRLPGGLKFPIKEQGSNLSHGQRQLIAFARALVRDPSLVILDEATSSIDPESEQIVQEAIGRILKGRSVMVIAHRLATVRLCDQILVLEKGQVKESGKHDDLIAQKGAYFKLHHALG
jgi:ATP-binding cassette subfamily B protein